MSAPTKTWTFSDEAGANLRLQIVSLAVRAHESGLAIGDSVLDTARQLTEFIQGDN